MATRETTHDRTLSLGPDDDGRPTTAEEFAEAEYKGPYRYERVEGRLIVMSPEGTDHARLASRWQFHLSAYAKDRPDVVDDVFAHPWVRLEDRTDRIGDVGVYLAREGPPWEVPVRAPDIMIEVVSKSARDRRRDFQEKRADYHRIGIREYVILDHFRHRVTVFTHAPGDYLERTLGPDDTYTSALLPGLEIALADLLGR